MFVENVYVYDGIATVYAMTQSLSVFIHRQSYKGGWGGITSELSACMDKDKKSGLGNQATSSSEAVWMNESMNKWSHINAWVGNY